MISGHQTRRILLRHLLTTVYIPLRDGERRCVPGRPVLTGMSIVFHFFVVMLIVHNEKQQRR